jgi:transposase
VSPQGLGAIISTFNPSLLATNGVGVVTAATLLTAMGDNPERVAAKAQFAVLCGVAPIPASSGQCVRHRLSRGGNRQANHALHRIALVRMRHREPRTIAYFDKRRAEGLSDRDIIRCLKRHIADEIFRILTDPDPVAPAGPLLRQQRQAFGIPITVLADTLGVPYQRLRRRETGNRHDPELQSRAHEALEHIAHTPLASNRSIRPRGLTPTRRTRS